GLGYHLVGRDIRQDFGDWYSHLTGEDFLHLGLALGGVVVLVVVATGLVRILRRIFPLLETYTLTQLGHPKNQATLERWFRLCETFTLLAVRLAAIGAGGHLLGLGHWADVAFGFLLRLVAIVAVARLLTLACRATTHLITDHGSRQFG